jgi:hypothetical protein
MVHGDRLGYQGTRSLTRMARADVYMAGLRIMCVQSKSIVMVRDYWWIVY